MNASEKIRNYALSSPKNMQKDFIQEYTAFPYKSYCNFRLILYDDNAQHMDFLEKLEKTEPIPGLSDTYRFVAITHDQDKDFNGDLKIHTHLYLSIHYRKDAKTVGTAKTWEQILDILDPFDFNAATCQPVITGLEEWAKYTSHFFQEGKALYDPDYFFSGEDDTLRLKAVNAVLTAKDSWTLDEVMKFVQKFFSMYDHDQYTGYISLRMVHLWMIDQGFSWKRILDPRVAGCLKSYIGDVNKRADLNRGYSSSGVNTYVEAYKQIKEINKKEKKKNEKKGHVT